ncbi:cytochrome C [bacterium]|nr:cytochrome C [bacterium]MBU1993882.1 cytochrome C [bacterium]
MTANEDGSLLFHGNCITCHFETKTVSAPSVVDFKEHYLRAFPKKEDFVNYMSIWVQHPKEETSIMLESVEKHGIMPELGFDLETLKEISEYIYETDFKNKHKGHKD